MSVYVVKFFVLVDFLMLLFYCVFNVIQMLFTFILLSTLVMVVIYTLWKHVEYLLRLHET